MLRLQEQRLQAYIFFLEGKINKPGVFAPEGGVIDTQDFFNAYAELEGLEKGLDISRSWEI